LPYHARMPRHGGEAWISVDVEASGPTPGTGSLVAIGACPVDRPEASFYVELQEIPGMPWGTEEERVHGISRAHLAEHGASPPAAMRAFAHWIERECDGATPVFVAFNATYDWMWVADYFHRFHGSNPFGVSGLDLKALYLGRHLPEVTEWRQTVRGAVRERYPTPVRHSHHALDDAREQAELCRRMLDRP